MSVDRQKLYENAEDFFALDGSAVMKLSRHAAKEVCSRAATKELVVVKLEGGIWNDRKFEARLDAIWDGLDPPADPDSAHRNNLLAVTFIQSADPAYNAFILTSVSVKGYSPRQPQGVLVNKP